VILESPQVQTAPTYGEDVATFGPYRLQRLSDKHYRLTGPDDRFPADWLRSNIPGDGEWWTEWAGQGDSFALDVRR
jgi:hypothetical protein